MVPIIIFGRAMYVFSPSLTSPLAFLFSYCHRQAAFSVLAYCLVFGVHYSFDTNKLAIFFFVYYRLVGRELVVQVYFRPALGRYEV